MRRNIIKGAKSRCQPPWTSNTSCIEQDPQGPAASKDRRMPGPGGCQLVGGDHLRFRNFQRVGFLIGLRFDLFFGYEYPVQAFVM